MRAVAEARLQFREPTSHGRGKSMARWTDGNKPLNPLISKPLAVDAGKAHSVRSYALVRSLRGQPTVLEAGKQSPPRVAARHIL